MKNEIRFFMMMLIINTFIKDGLDCIKFNEEIFG